MKRKKGSFFYETICFLAKSFFKLFYRHKVYGLEHFFLGGAIIASNHTSFYDPQILAVSWPEEVHFLAKEYLFRFPLLGWLIRKLNTHPVKGGAKDVGVLKTTCQLLEEDKKIILFPEGTRSFENRLMPFKSGVAMLLLRSKKAIIPAYIDGAYSAWPRKKKFPKLWGKTACVFGSPILYASFETMEKKDAECAITQALKEKIFSLKSWLESGHQGIPP